MASGGDDDGGAWKKKYKRILIFGASSGYGAAIAKTYAGRGHCMLTLVGRNASKLEKVEKECRAAGAFDVVIMTADCTDFASTKTLTEEALTTFGGLEMVVYAIVGLPKAQKFDEMRGDGLSKSLKECMNTNYFGCVWAVHAAYPLLKRYKGHFVCITSITAEMSTPQFSLLAGATHAIHGFMDGIQKENAGFEITLVCSPPVYSPGQTPQSPDALPLNQGLAFLLEAVDKKKKKAFLGAAGIFSDSPSLMMASQAAKASSDSMAKIRNILNKAPPCREMKAHGVCPRGTACPFSHDRDAE